MDSENSKTSKPSSSPDRIWFRNKRYGWGWFPITWEGWATLVVYLVALFAAVSRMKAESPHAVPQEFFPQIVGLTGLLLIVCLVKGEAPRWRWGK